MQRSPAGGICVEYDRRIGENNSLTRSTFSRYVALQIGKSLERLVYRKTPFNKNKDIPGFNLRLPKPRIGICELRLFHFKMKVPRQFDPMTK